MRDAYQSHPSIMDITEKSPIFEFENPAGNVLLPVPASHLGGTHQRLSFKSGWTSSHWVLESPLGVSSISDVGVGGGQFPSSFSLQCSEGHIPGWENKGVNEVYWKINLVLNEGFPQQRCHQKKVWKEVLLSVSLISLSALDQGQRTITQNYFLIQF